MTQPVSLLPTEILLQIVYWLPLDARISLLHASKRFLQIGTDPSLWSKIVLIRDFSQSNTYISQLYQRDQIVNQARVRSVLTGTDDFETEGTITGNGKKQVNDIDTILGCILGTIIPSVGPISLTEVNMRGLVEKFTDSHLMQIARWSPHLTSVCVSGTSVTDAGIQYLFGSVTSYERSLEALRDGVSRSRHTSSTMNGVKKSVSSSTASFPTSSHPPPPPPPAFSQTFLDFTIQEYSVTSERCTSDSIHLHNARERQIVDTITRDLSSLLPSAFMNTYPGATYTTSSITEEEPETSTTRPRCPNIQHLFLSGSKPITDKTVARIAYSAIYLKTLDLTSFTSSSRVSDDAIVLVAKLCTGLETLQLSGCSQITDDSLMALAGWNKCPTEVGGRKVRDIHKLWEKWHQEEWTSPLKRLEISGCFQVTDFGVSAVLIECKLLEILDLGYCWRITDASLVAVEEALITDRRMLFWKDCPKISCIGLKFVSLRFCYLVTDVGVSELFRKDGTGKPVYQALARVDVTSCQRITRSLENKVMFWDAEDEFEREM